MTDEKPKQDLIAPMAQIVAGYASHHKVDDLAALMRQVYKTLQDIAGDTAGSAKGRQEPAVAIEKSVMPDYLVCLEDGKKLKMLKRYLKTAFGMTPEQYREKWNLPADYPMVAPSYARRRSNLAKEIGLGTHNKK
jgi:predicted transcriptional regulator